MLGYPQPRIQGLSPKITQGIINGAPNARQQAEDRGYLQISAEVSRGNSGGPLVGADGSIIGMVQRKLDSQRIMDRTQEMTVNVSFALRSSQILDFLADSPMPVQARPINLQKVLRAHEVFALIEPSVVSVIVNQSEPMPPAKTAP